MDQQNKFDPVVRALRRVTIQGSLLGQTVAIRLGLSDSDVEALEVLIDTGPATAGRLADAMGLTTGAVTRMVDRLEQAGYVVRVSDPADRRRVVIEPVPERIARVREIIDTVAAAAAREIGRYSPEQLATIGDFLERMAETTRSERDRLREAAGGTDDSTIGSVNAAPLGGLREARLVFRNGASNVVLRGDASLAELYRARFEGSVPQVRLRDGVVSVQYRGGFFDWRKREAAFALSTAVDWTIEVRGGISNVEASLGEVRVRSLDVSGGASKIKVVLGRPVGEVPIRIGGGAGDVSIVRPADVPVRLSVKGGAGRVQLDDQHIGGTSEVQLDSASGAGSPDRYVVEVSGGASSVTVATVKGR